jgi:LemA protein
MHSLMEELTSTENKVGFSRQHYNDSVMVYNTALESFPTNLMAGTFKFQRSEFFQVEDAAERKPVKVEF